MLIVTAACGSTTSPSSTTQNKVVFDQTVSAVLLTPAFILASSQQTLAWSCDASGGGSLLIYIGAAGSYPSDAQPIFKGICGISESSGTQTLHIPAGSYFLRFLPGGSWHITLTDIDYSTTLATAIARSPIPTETPAPTPPTFSPSVGYQTAWGTHAATATYTMTLDGTHTFFPSSVSPDGTMLLGNEEIAPSNPTAVPNLQGGYYDLATKHFTAIGVSDGGDPVGCCTTDGRFLIAIDHTEPGAPFGSDGIRYWAYDRQTGRLRQVGKTGDAMGGLFTVTHGLLIFSSPNGAPGSVMVANLATGTIAPLTASPTNSGTGLVAITWPDLVYAILDSDGTPTAFGVHNLATNQHTLLPSLEAFNTGHSVAGSQIPYVAGSQIAYSIVGDTLIAAVPSNQTPTLANSYGSVGTTTFYALIHVLSGGTQVTQLGSFTSEGSAGYTVVDNTLYVSVLTGQVTGQAPPQLGAILDIGWTTLYAIDQITSGGTPPQLLGTFNGDALDIVGANARVIACAGGDWDATLVGSPVFWDLALHTFVTFPTFTGNDLDFLIDLAGSNLVVAQGSQTSEALLFLDTSTLPAAHTAGGDEPHSSPVR
ncbi:MAG: hypothetical protein ACLQUY_06550 [Ktedonobacterales bacterium]